MLSQNFLAQVEQNAHTHPSFVVLSDDKTSGVTYRQLQELSGRVYRYLKKQHIGREDLVFICLPRGVSVVIALYGVLRSGAAFVIAEENEAPERIAYIKKDCGCKLVIDHAIWEEIQHEQTLEGYAPFEPHAAAFAVYTSGTTGKPKGVLHEYGTLTRIHESVHLTAHTIILPKGERFALTAPLNFMASLIILLVGLWDRFWVNLVPYAVVKHPIRLQQYLKKHRITALFLPPSYIQLMQHCPDGIRHIYTGSEVAGSLYLEGCDIYNCYTMSETGFLVAYHLIDHPYEATPVGVPRAETRVLLLDERGRAVPSGAAGEICVETLYTRGYLHLPEETAKAFQNGFYHTGDLGRYDENGRLVVIGRLNDMVKINGNRVEPGEIEQVASTVLGVDWTAVRIFDENETVRICVYYLADIEVDTAAVQEKMKQYLPYYMIPSFFLRIDTIPRLPNGKLDRHALPEPQPELCREAYVPPTNAEEETLCRAFETVLKLEHVGIRDDFYRLGGDSIRTIEVVVESGLKDLNAADLFQYRTPERIAAAYRNAQTEAKDDSPDAFEDRARRTTQKLTTGQLYMVDYQLYTPRSTMYNLFELLRFEQSAMDAETLAAAVNQTIQNHPALLTQFFFNEDGEIMQQYLPKQFRPVCVERLSEAELAVLKDELVQPFRVFQSCLYRARIFQTESAVYFFFDVHHTAFDGSSFRVFFQDILNAYLGLPLQMDYYYSTIQKRQDEEQLPLYLEAKQYFEERYGGIEWEVYPTADVESKGNEMGELSRMLSFSGDALKERLEPLSITKNEFFLTVALLAISFYNQKEPIKLSWIYHGREDLAAMQSVGLLFRDLPVAEVISPDKTIGAIIDSVKEQVQEGIRHSIYPYIEKDAGAVVDDVACLMYQGTLRDLDPNGISVEEVPIRQNDAASQSILDMEVWDLEDGIELLFQYNSNRYRRSSMERYTALFCRIAERLMQAHSAQQTVRQIRNEVGQDLISL